MRILLITQLFQPEPNHLKGIEFAKELQKNGHEVQVLTGFPNYPGGIIYNGYRLKWKMREYLEGVEVIRVLHYLSHGISSIGRIFNYCTFAFFASVIGVFSVKRPDVIHVYQGPATLMFPAFIAKIWYRSRIVLDVQDIWPESVQSSGMFQIPGGIWLLKIWCQWTYKVSDRIITLSEGYKSSIEKRGVIPSKVDVIYNWCDERSILKENIPLDVHRQVSLTRRFNIVFAGTMGKVQSLDAVLEAAGLILKELPIVQFVFVGGGIEAGRLENLALRRNLHNVVFIPRQPASEISKILSSADALLIHLRDDELGRIGIPQKTQSSLAIGKPIIMAVTGEAARLVKEANSGIICIPEKAESIAEAVREMLSMSPNKRKTLGENGKRFYEENLSFRIGFEKIINIYKGVLVGK